MQTLTRWAMVMCAGASLALSGCQVNESKNGDGKDVKIATPFGGMHVNTNDAEVPGEIGLPIYPGATVVKKDNDHGAADVNMSFGSFQMRVKAVEYRTGDAPDKVEDFYRNGLKRYGDVIACRGGQPVGTPPQTAEGLTCDTKHGNHVTVDEHTNKSDLELKAGSKQHQHIVSFEPEGAGTKFGLVALDLPAKLFTDDSGSGGDRQ